MKTFSFSSLMIALFCFFGTHSSRAGMSTVDLECVATDGAKLEFHNAEMPDSDDNSLSIELPPKAPASRKRVAYYVSSDRYLTQKGKAAMPGYRTALFARNDDIEIGLFSIQLFLRKVPSDYAAVIVSGIPASLESEGQGSYNLKVKVTASMSARKGDFFWGKEMDCKLQY